MRAIGVPVYLLPGNHDPLDASSVYTSALFIAECPDNVTVLDRRGRARGAARACRSSPRRGVPRRRPPTWSPTCSPGLPADGVTRILVGHGGVDILDPDPDQAVADPAGRAGGRAGARRRALCGVGRQALSHPGRRHRPGLVLRLAGGHQLRRHRARPRARAGRRHRRDGSRTSGARSRRGASAAGGS